MHVLVAGGGITGLAAALHLVEGGAEVTLVEPADRLGGMVRTSPFAGRPVDEGADAFLIRTPAALALARRVGLGDDLVHPARATGPGVRDGELLPLPAQVLGVPVDLEELARSGLVTDDGLARLRRDLDRPGRPAARPRRDHRRGPGPPPRARGPGRAWSIPSSAASTPAPPPARAWPRSPPSSTPPAATRTTPA